MKKIFAASVVAMLFALSAFAAEEPTVTITSFAPVGQATRAAELCGKVSNMGVLPMGVVRIVADPNHNPGVFNTLVGKDGEFCAVIATYYGRASVSFQALGIESAAMEVRMSYTNFRN